MGYYFFKMSNVNGDKEMFLRKKDYKKIFFIIIITIIVFILILYRGIGPASSNNGDIPKETHEKISVWIVDWQWEAGIKDLKEIEENLSSLQVFAAYFDYHDNLHFTNEFNEALPEIMKINSDNKLANLYITIVNDRFNEEGKAVQKDPELLKRLMATEESRNNHIDEIINMVTQKGFNGVEIDYENIDDDIWENYIDFCSKLYQKLSSIDKSLRIVLEPKTPIDKLTLPEGPDYVMMAYNLYGYHSGPGPKADEAFIRDLGIKMEKIPGDKIIAFATGGFDWSEDGKVTALTEIEAIKLSEKAVDNLKRDESSGSVYFNYFDDNNINHTVWYADNRTLDKWFNISKQLRYNKISLWRLGDMQQKTLDYLNLDANY